MTLEKIHLAITKAAYIATRAQKAKLALNAGDAASE
jgi:hypothetical protein